MGGDRLAHDGPGAGDEVEHPGRKAGVVDDLGEDERVERRYLARLEHDRAACADGGRDLRHDLVQRVVPRRDAPDDAQRFPHDERVADLLLEGELVDNVDVGAHDHGRQAGLDHLREHHRHPDLAGDGLRDLLHTGVEAFVQLLEVLRPLLDRRRAPGLEGPACRLGRAVDVLGRALGNAAHDRFGRGVDHVDGPGPGGRCPRAVDVELVAVLHPVPLAPDDGVAVNASRRSVDSTLRLPSPGAVCD